MTTEDHIAAVKAQYPDACEQKLGKMTRIVWFENGSDESALSYYYGLPEDAWANAFENTQ